MAGVKAFDVDAAEEAAMLTFWAHGYADASIGALGTAMHLGRGSLYNAFGDKAGLFSRCLARYGARYGELYEAALAAHPLDLVAALDAFFDVTLQRIADPGVPRGCLIAQSVLTSASLPEQAARQADNLLGLQSRRIQAALRAAGVSAAASDDLALQLAAVNQSLAVLSGGSTPDDDLRGIARAAARTAAASVG